MRMWMIPPEQLCNKHLLGEHGEIHKFRPSFVKGVRIDGRIKPVAQIEPASMKARHDELTAEMERRFSKKYDSPYEQPDLSHYPPEQVNAKVDPSRSRFDLIMRCPDCLSRIVASADGKRAIHVMKHSKYGK